MESKKNDKTFEEHLKNAKDVVGKLESGDCTLDDMLNLYQDAIESLRICNEKLASFEETVKLIRRDNEKLNYDDLE